MASKRLPGKVLEEVAGVPMIVHLLRRLSESDLIDDIVVGTGPGADNEILRFVVEEEGYSCPYVECDEDDVLTRYLTIAESYDADIVVRITGDCPLVDPEIVDSVIVALGNNEFSTNVLHRTYARGMDVEVMSMACLRRLDKVVRDARREHVTLYVYDNPHEFRIGEVTDIVDNSDITLCVDYPEDLELVREVFDWMCPREKSYREIVRYVREAHGPAVDRISSRGRSAASGY